MTDPYYMRKAKEIQSEVGAPFVMIVAINSFGIPTIVGHADDEFEKRAGRGDHGKIEKFQRIVGEIVPTDLMFDGSATED